ncbi:hypothetical protein [Amaricoccus sp.]|uniref:hypothetical protein n=1 Tax=Amaricoccus sp. TaxID=1872485 RepID=UPI002C0AAB22|nr:hypothetical protein [Amaricoccus sp.]HRW15488.1 hypothetical protein [Amaricoccus sp.]
MLRDSIATESVDLIYLDPPFNSSAGCRLWSKGSAGTQDVVQIEDFDESEQWHGTVRETQPESLRS